MANALKKYDQTVVRDSIEGQHWHENQQTRKCVTKRISTVSVSSGGNKGMLFVKA